MFEPPFCPNRLCDFHLTPIPGFFIRHGWYRPRCRVEAVPRFRCTGCADTFSRQTFRCDFRMKKPHVLGRLFEHVVSGGSLRQIARLAHVARRTIARAFVRIGDHAKHYHDSALTRFVVAAQHAQFQFDELETYELDRILQPITVGTLLQEETRFLVGIECGTMRSRCDKSVESKERRAEFERKHGQRRNQTRAVIGSLLTVLAKIPKADGAAPLRFTTDEKRIYPPLLKAAFGDPMPPHRTVSSRLVRDGRNPLAPINQLDVMTRHHNARLQRESIAASKKIGMLARQMSVFVAWWNYWRKRKNEDRESPAVFSGVLPRRARTDEIFGWSHAFGPGRMPLIETA